MICIQEHKRSSQKKQNVFPNATYVTCFLNVCLCLKDFRKQQTRSLKVFGSKRHSLSQSICKKICISSGMPCSNPTLQTEGKHVSSRWDHGTMSWARPGPHNLIQINSCSLSIFKNHIRIVSKREEKTKL